MLLWKTDRERNEQWAAYCQERGYAMLGTAPALLLRALVQGVTVSASEWVDTVTRPNDHGIPEDHHVRRAQVSAVPGVPVGDLHVTPEGLGAKILKMFGGQDIEVGDAEFDRLFRVRSKLPAAVPTVLTPNACRALVRVHADVPDIAIEEGLVRWTGHELKDAHQLDTLVRAIAYATSWLGR